jgi:hypothetical protein
MRGAFGFRRGLKALRLDDFDGGDGPAQPTPRMAEAVAPTP